jgi:septal ring-binding cell division protein DamX
MKTLKIPTHHRKGTSLLLLLISLTFAPWVIAETINIPIKLDYPLLRQLMMNQLFDTPDRTAEIVQDPSGCNEIFLSNPRLRKKRHHLEISTHVKAHVGTAIFGTCARLLYWEGDAKFLTEPVILPGATSVKLNILDTQLYNPQGERITSGRLWDIAEGQLQALMSQYQIDLTPSLSELNKLLPEVLRHRSAHQIMNIVDSLRLAAIQVEDDAIDVTVSMQIKQLPQASQPEAILSEQEMQQWEKNWRMMDAMITFAVKRYALLTNQQELRDTLLEILLDARYQLNTALTQPVSHGNDPVRQWFIDSWERLGPTLRQISLERSGQEPMLLLSLITATNALKALDQLGPSFGLDISADGLRRMGRLLINRSGIDPLHYDQSVDPELQRLFQLPGMSEIKDTTGFHLNIWPINSAWAKTTDNRLNLWVPKKNELSVYLPQVRNLLMDTATVTAQDGKLNNAIAKLYKQLVLTTAWQESCWRQYTIEKSKIVPLRSHTGDSGLMQMNERVWRGFYDAQKLRWDIAYNANAGSEVLLNYLVKYALKKGEDQHKGGLDNLARATYSAYNGGPSKVSRYRNVKAAPAHKKIDKAFWSKFKKVKRGNEMDVAQCLGADPKNIAISEGPKRSSTTRTTRNTGNKSSVPAKTQVGRPWVLAQNHNHFTLQLAVFSSLKAAKKFTDSVSLDEAIAIAPLGKDKRGKFVVMSGSYKSRSEADKAKERLKKLKPWVRQFKDIQTAIKP